MIRSFFNIKLGNIRLKSIFLETMTVWASFFSLFRVKSFLADFFACIVRCYFRSVSWYPCCRVHTYKLWHHVTEVRSFTTKIIQSCQKRNLKIKEKKKSYFYQSRHLHPDNNFHQNHFSSCKSKDKASCKNTSRTHAWVFPPRGVMKTNDCNKIHRVAEKKQKPARAVKIIAREGWKCFCPPNCRPFCLSFFLSPCIWQVLKNKESLYCCKVRVIVGGDFFPNAKRSVVVFHGGNCRPFHTLHSVRI